MVAIDPFALFMKLIVYGSMLLVAVAGGGYLNKHVSAVANSGRRSIRNAAMSFAVKGDEPAAAFVAIEFLSITSYILVGFVREDLRRSRSNSFTRFGCPSVMLYGMSLLYGASGSLMLVDIGAATAKRPELAIVLRHGGAGDGRSG